MYPLIDNANEIALLAAFRDWATPLGCTHKYKHVNRYVQIYLHIY